MAVERHSSYYDIDQEIEVTSPRTVRSLSQYDHNHSVYSVNLSIKIVSTLLISNMCRSSHKNSETQKIKTTTAYQVEAICTTHRV